MITRPSNTRQMTAREMVSQLGVTFTGTGFYIFKESFWLVVAPDSFAENVWNSSWPPDTVIEVQSWPGLVSNSILGHLIMVPTRLDKR